MTASYPEFPLRENTVDWSSLSRGCFSFCRWVNRWHKQTGEVSPTTVYLAYKQARHKRTLYRWLAEAEAAGAIQRESPGTKERVIIPLAEPPKTSHKQRKTSIPLNKNVTQNVTQNVTLPSCIDAVRRNATTVQCEPATKTDSGGLGLPQSQSATPAQSSTENPPDAFPERIEKGLAALGVSFPVAAALASEKPQESAEQLAALPYRQAKDKAAVLVASIKQAWPLPEAYKAAVARKQKEAAEAQNRALRAELAKKRETTRSGAKSQFSGLPDTLRAELLDQAAAALRAELPAAWNLMQKRSEEVRTTWIAARAMSMLEGGCNL